jgi:hypothetical protein
MAGPFCAERRRHVKAVWSFPLDLSRDHLTTLDIGAEEATVRDVAANRLTNVQRP